MSDAMSYDNHCLIRFSRFSDFPNSNVAIFREMLHLLRCKIMMRVISSL